MKPIAVVDLNSLPSEDDINQLEDEGYLVVTSMSDVNAVKVLESDLRDQFAMAALPGLISNKHNEEWYSCESACNEAYQYADAMMKAREE